MGVSIFFSVMTDPSQAWPGGVMSAHDRHAVNAVSKFPTCAVGKFPSTDMVISH
ncbi:hypothetical protein SXCC_04752 [Gluconacetobacter sp. SXCC-1]|nr:hypothetical protein SXCC_04752 [Gluconacetobacter sp. SXCC-1]